MVCSRRRIKLIGADRKSIYRLTAKGVVVIREGFSTNSSNKASGFALILVLNCYKNRRSS